MSISFKHELYAIISGKSEVRHGKVIQAIADYLRKGETTSSEIKGSKFFKAQEKQRLATYISENRLWVDELDPSQYVSEGAEQKVYLHNQKSVYKLNDSIFYNSWLDYFHNLLLDNAFFEDTAYQLLGFYKKEQCIYAVVEQPFVESTSPTDLNQVKSFLNNNGFSNTRNNDFYNPEIGIILEDLHDENVLTKDGLLYFIDTVFYITDEFWKDVDPNGI
jgi:hypothetical protein